MKGQHLCVAQISLGRFFVLIKIKSVVALSQLLLFLRNTLEGEKETMLLYICCSKKLIVKLINNNSVVVYSEASSSSSLLEELSSSLELSSKSDVFTSLAFSNS